MTWNVAAAEQILVCRLAGRLCGLPLEHVAETMRPLPVVPLPAAPAGVLGLAVVRGVPTAVVAPSLLLGHPAAVARRLVIVRIAERNVALAVDEVVGVRALPAAERTSLPPLLREAEADLVSRVAALDHELLLLLEGARLLPELPPGVDRQGSMAAVEGSRP